MTYLVVLRLLVDYFWGLKALSVAHSVIGTFMLGRRLKVGLAPGLVGADVAVLFFTTMLIFNYAIYFDNNTIDFAKLMSISLFYFLGRFSRLDVINYKYISNFSISALFFLYCLSVIGVGYVEWGNYLTFTGGYYFKTDLALAVVIFFVFGIGYYLNRSILISVIILFVSVWLIWVSNARVSILALTLAAGIMGCFKYRKLGFWFLLIWVFFLALVAVLGLVYFESSGDSLGFDFDDFFGEANLQGRNWIWLSVLQYYEEYDLLNKFVGTGLSADVMATSKYSLAFGLDSSRAHNSFLYLLVCMGLVGVVLFFAILLFWFYEIIKALQYDYEPLLVLCACFFAIFIVFSFTTEAVIRAQIMVPFSFFMGRLVLLNSGEKGL